MTAQQAKDAGDSSVMSRRNFLVAATTTPFASSSHAGWADRFPAALQSDKQPLKTKDDIITFMKNNGFVEDPTVSPPTPVNPTTLSTKLAKSYTIVGFQFGACTDQCPPSVAKFADLHTQKGKTPIKFLIIDAAAQDTQSLRDMIAKAGIKKDDLMVYSPPIHKSEIATNMQHRLGLMAQNNPQKDVNGQITDLGHSPNIHIFAPDGRRITGERGIDAMTMDPKKVLKLIQDHAQQQGAAR